VDGACPLPLIYIWYRYRYGDRDPTTWTIRFNLCHAFVFISFSFSWSAPNKWWWRSSVQPSQSPSADYALFDLGSDFIIIFLFLLVWVYYYNGASSAETQSSFISYLSLSRLCGLIIEMDKYKAGALFSLSLGSVVSPVSTCFRGYHNKQPHLRHSHTHIISM